MFTFKDIEYEWSDYCTARESRIKPLWKKILYRNIERIESLTGMELEEYLEAIFEACYDHHNYWIPIGHPSIWNKIIALWSSKMDFMDAKHWLWIYKISSGNKVYQLTQLSSYEILDKVLELDPNNAEAKGFLLEDKLNSLGFALHHLPDGLLMSESLCLSIVDECETMIKQNPEIYSVQSRQHFENSRLLLESWIEYSRQDINENFHIWHDDRVDGLKWQKEINKLINVVCYAVEQRKINLVD